MFNRIRKKRPEPPKASTPSSISSQVEGFVCPACLIKFGTQEALQHHFLTAHADDEPTNVPTSQGTSHPANPTPDLLHAETNVMYGQDLTIDEQSVSNVSVLRRALMELQKENAELKIQLQRVPTTDSNMKEELLMLEMQLKAASESKALMSEQLVTFQQDAANEKLALMDDFATKENLLLQQINDLKTGKVEKLPVVDLHAEGNSLSGENGNINYEDMEIPPDLSSELFKQNTDSKELVSLQQELKHRDNKIADLSNEITNLTKNNDIQSNSLLEEIDNLKSQLEQNQSDFHQEKLTLQQVIQSHSDREVAYKTEMEKISKDAETKLSQELTKVTNEKGSMAQTMLDNAQKAHLDKVNFLESQIQNLTKELENVTTDFDKERAQLVSQSTQNSDTLLQSFETERLQLNSLLEQRDLKINELSSQLVELETSLSQLKTTNKEEIANVLSESEEIKAQLLKDKKGLSEGHNNELRKLREEFAGEKSVLNAKCAQLDQTVVELKEQLALSSNKTDLLEGSLTEAQRRFEEMVSTVQELTVRKNELEKNLELKASELSSLNDETQCKTTSLAEIEACLQDKDKAMKMLAEEADDLKIKLKQKETELATQSSEFKNLKTEFAEVKSVIKTLEQSQETSQNVIKDLESSQAITQQLLTEKTQALDRVVAEKDEVLSKLDSNEATQTVLNQKDSELETLKQALEHSKTAVQEIQAKANTDIQDLKAKIDILNKIQTEKDKMLVNLEEQLVLNQKESVKIEEEMANLSNKLKKRSDSNSALEEKLSKLTDKLAASQRAKASAEKDVSDLSKKFEEAMETLNTSFANCKVLQSKLNVKDSECATLTKQLEVSKVNSANSAKEIMQLKENHLKLSEEIRKLELDLANKEDSLQSTKSTVEDLESTNSSLSQKLTKANQKCQNLTDEIANLQTKAVKEKDAFSSAKLAWETTEETLKNELTNSQNKFKSDNDKFDNEINKMKDKIIDLDNHIKHKDQIINESVQKQNELESQLNDERKQSQSLKTELAEKTELYSNEMSLTTQKHVSEIEKLQQELGQVKLIAEKTTQESASLMQEKITLFDDLKITKIRNQQLSEEIETLKRVSDERINKLESEIASEKSSKELDTNKYTKEVDKLGSLVKDLEFQLGTEKSLYLEKCKIEEALASKLNRLLEEKGQLVETVAQWENKCATLEETVKLGSGKILDHEQALINMEQNNKNLQKVISDKTKEITNYENSLSSTQEAHKKIVGELTEKICTLEVEHDETRTKLSQCHHELDQLQSHQKQLSANHKTTCDSLKQTQTDLNNTKTALEEKTKLLQETEQSLNVTLSEVSKLTKTCESLNLQKEELKVKFEAEILELNSKLADYVQKQDILVNEKLSLIHQLQERTEELKSAEDIAASTIANKDSSIASLQAELEQLSASNEEYKKAKMELKSQLEDVASAHEVKVDSLETEMLQIKAEKLELAEKLSDMTGKQSEIHVSKNELERQVDDLEDEKRLLTEKLLKEKDEQDALTRQVVSLQREVENLQSALQEIGRDNQRLQVDQEHIRTRRWVRDDQATGCTRCHKQFSLTFRRHHCRSCGEVFCKDCSAHSVMLPGYKETVRVCDNCNQGHLNRSASVASSLASST